MSLAQSRATSVPWISGVPPNSMNFPNFPLKLGKISQIHTNSPKFHPIFPNFSLKLLKITRFENNASLNFPRKTVILPKFWCKFHPAGGSGPKFSCYGNSQSGQCCILKIAPMKWMNLKKREIEVILEEKIFLYIPFGNLACVDFDTIDLCIWPYCPWGLKPPPHLDSFSLRRNIWSFP